MMNVKINPEPVIAALTKIYTDGFLLGLDASAEAINRAEKTSDKAALTKADEYIDWANWKPGNRAAALLFRPTGAFKEILDNAGIVSKAIAKVGYDRIGTALSDSIAAGFSPGRAAKVIAAKIGDPARALTIAITEQNRAMSMATIQNYQKYEVEKMEWSGAMPCDICAPNEGQVVQVGQPFKSGHTQPPAHPNCRCALLPVLDESFYAEPTDGMTIITPTLKPTKPEVIELLTSRRLGMIGQAQDAKLGVLTREEYDALNFYKGSGYKRINDYLRTGDEYWKPLGDAVEQSRVKQIFDERIARIQNTILSTDPIEKSFITLRGVIGKFADEVWESAPGSVFQDNGFVSTTASMSKALQFGRTTQLQIINPAGTKGLAIEKVIDSGRTLKESEWLLPAGTKFEIVSKREEELGGRLVRVITVKVVQ
jgi:SPP1 gp7 family putative phage head morphogenesis protein